MEPVVITARLALPMGAPPVPHGGVAVSGGTIAAVGAAADLHRAFPGARTVHHPDCLLLPGLINAHVHLELGYLHGAIAPPRHFTDWVAQCLGQAPAPDALPAVVAQCVAAGLRMCRRAGVTTVGDIARHPGLVRPVLAQESIGAVSYAEVMAIGAQRDAMAEKLAALHALPPPPPHVRAGLSPHAPYTVDGPALALAASAAAAHHWPVCMHLAELPEEAEFLATGGGILGGPWRPDAATLPGRVARFAGGPVRWAAAYGLLPARSPVLLAHVNYVDDEELAILAASGAAVAYCPRTRGYFGHDARQPHRWRDMLAAAIPVALGTDSLASNPDLFLLSEAAYILAHQPQADPMLLLDMATRQGARALGMADRGVLAAGAAAHLAVFQLPATAFTTPAEACRALVTLAPEARDPWAT